MECRLYGMKRRGDKMTPKEAMEKQDGETPDSIPCGYIRAKAYKATGAESTYLRKLINDWEKEHEN